MRASISYYLPAAMQAASNPSAAYIYLNKNKFLLAQGHSHILETDQAKGRGVGGQGGILS